MKSDFFLYKFYKPKYQILKDNFNILISLTFIIQAFSLILKKTNYYNMDSEIIIKFLRNNTYDIINNVFFDSIISIDVNGNSVPKSTRLKMDKYRNSVRLKMKPSINSCERMFQNCIDIVEIDLSHFDASQVGNMGHMFYNCKSLTSINFTNFDTSSVHFSMHWMFSGCNKLYSLDLSGFNTRYVECMENMFENCYSLTSLNLSNFDTSGLTCYADLMFLNCNKLEYINLEKAFINNHFYKNDMFNGIPKNTVFCVNSNAPNTFKSYTNLGCSNSNSACDNNWRENQNKIIESDRSCTTSCQAPNNKYDILNKCYDKCTIILFLKGICKIEYEDKDKFIEEIIDSLMKGELTELLFDNIVKGENVIGYNDNEIIQISILSSQNKASDMRSIYFGEYKSILYEKYKNNCYLLIDGQQNTLSSEITLNENQRNKDAIEIKLIEVKQITNMSYMFENIFNFSILKIIKSYPEIVTCYYSHIYYLEFWKNYINYPLIFLPDIISLYGNNSFILIPDISNWNTENVTDMSYMFYGCDAISSIPDISNWNTKNVRNMSYMFSGCCSLKSLPDISKWNTENVIDMNNMFYNCKSLISFPDISKWNTENVTNLSCMFRYCKSIKELPDISKWNLKSVTDINSMFSFCVSLRSLPDFGKWNTMNITNMTFLFHFCNSLVSLPDLSKWNIKNITDINSIFRYCNSLTSIPDISNWDIKNVTNMSYMFYNCNSLTSLPNISIWNTKNVTNMSYMFYNCNSLTSLPDISKWEFNQKLDKTSMLKGCNSTIIPEKFTETTCLIF